GQPLAGLSALAGFALYALGLRGAREVALAVVFGEAAARRHQAALVWARLLRPRLALAARGFLLRREPAARLPAADRSPAAPPPRTLRLSASIRLMTLLAGGVSSISRGLRCSCLASISSRSAMV